MRQGAGGGVSITAAGNGARNISEGKRQGLTKARRQGGKDAEKTKKKGFVGKGNAWGVQVLDAGVFADQKGRKRGVGEGTKKTNPT